MNALATVLAAAILVRGVWSQPAITTGVVYATIENRESRTDTLLSASSPQATRVEFHRSSRSTGHDAMDGMAMGGMVTMQSVATIDVPARGRVTLAPGGLHLMLVGLRYPLAAGDTIVLELKFRRAGTVRTLVRVRSFAQAAP